MKTADIEITKLLRFEPAAGRISLGGRRLLLFDAAATGAMREQLIKTLGEAVARGILMRWGYQTGLQDARSLGEQFAWDSEREWMLSGPLMHEWEGICAVETTELRFDRAQGALSMTGVWRNSYEAEQHVKSFGHAEDPVCWTLTGYAAGWTTGVMGAPMIAVETACVGRGDPACGFAIRPRGEWGEEAAAAIAALAEEQPIQRLEDRVDAARRALKEKNVQLERVASELAESNQRLRELDRLKTEFFANISHEFRTPLTLNLGPLEEMLAEPRPPKDQARLDLMHRNALRLLRLVNNLLDFAQIEAGKMRAVYRRVNLRATTKDLCASFESSFIARGLTLTFADGADDVVGYVDLEMWEKIVSNLLANALKFTAKGGVTLQLATAPGRLVLEVADTGPGIASEELPHIFTRFHRAEQIGGRSHEGVGLGLPLVSELCKLHGGEVTVDSRLGAGATFRVALPAGRDHLPADRVLEEPVAADALLSPQPLDAAAAAASAVPTPVRQAPTSPRERILIVEDNADLRAYLAGLLGARFEVEVAGDGAEALACARANPPSLVLTDVMMPGLDGFGLLERLKFDPLTASVAVVMLTARAELGEKLRGLEIGADDYVLKPFNPRELLARITAQVSLRRAQRQLEHYATELERLVEEQVGEIRRQNRTLEDAQHEMEDFLFIASHDLQAPLVTIAGYAHLLQTRLQSHLGAVEVRAAERIQLAVKAMQALIDSLLALARVRHREPERRRVDLRELLATVIVQLGAKIDETGAKLEVQRVPHVAHGDATQLSQILRNLVENAIKYRDEARPLKIDIGAADEEGALTLWVRDNGVGIAPEHHHLIFRPLARLEQVRQVGGTGMGLYIVRKIAEAQGGKAWVESQLGLGSTFYVRLPRVPERTTR
ncbi:MAG TPA: ATP-binding protein [Candidatus Deferrimicrobiaceae bacterium]|jgi:signal transduction histidine kinase